MNQNQNQNENQNHHHHHHHHQNHYSPRSHAMASVSNGTTDKKAHVEDGKGEVATPCRAGTARHPYLEQYQANAAKHAATGATGRPTLRSTGGRRVPSALRIAAPAATSGTGAAVVNAILNQKHTAAALPARSELDKRTLGMAAKIRAKAVAHMADRELQYDPNARRKVVRFASKDMQQHNDDHLRSVPTKVRRPCLSACCNQTARVCPSDLYPVSFQSFSITPSKVLLVGSAWYWRRRNQRRACRNDRRCGR